MRKRGFFFSFLLMTVFLTALPNYSVAAAVLPTAKKDVVAELISLKDKNNHLQKELISLDVRLNDVDSRLNQLNNKIIDKEFSLNKEIKKLSQRAKAMYKDGRHHTTLQLLLESESVYDLLTRMNFFSLVLKEDLRLVKKSRADKTQLVNLKANYISKRQKIVIFKQAKQRTLQTQKETKEKLQKRLKAANQHQINQMNIGLDSASFYNNYLSSKGSPMTGLGITLVTAGRQYNINPDLVVAISGVESGFGLHNAGAYNAWGRKARGGGYASFSSWQDSIINQTSYLRGKYYNIGLTNVFSIGKKYAPGNGSWPIKVNHFLGDIQGFRNK